ncbi:Hsp20/alpha crystallin family protein [Achromobacter sp. F4_2707]|uniref:Hsp20/alpha crystallin family protein n=1 Tax=Achromobacter sp. F4_2707 TaxID=3114286 RepID=UPI0039C60FBB
MNDIVRRDPFSDLLRGFFVRPVDFDFDVSTQAPEMRVDVKENADHYAVSAELPGVAKDDIHVNIDGQLVSISAERKQEKETRDGERVLRTERYFGKVSRSFQLGQEVDEARASAKFKDGVLELTLPKKAPAQAKRLTIE